MCQRYAGRAITGQFKTTPTEAILAEAFLPTVAKRATKFSTIAMEKPLRMPDTNPRRQLAIERVCQRTKNKSWRKIASEACRSIYSPRKKIRHRGSYHPGNNLKITFTRWMVQSQVKWSKTKLGATETCQGQEFIRSYHLHRSINQSIVFISKQNVNKVNKLI